MSQKIKIAFLTILGLMLINYSSVFASSVSIEKIEEIIQEYNSTWTLNERQLTKFEECLSSYNYMSFTKDKSENNLFFIFYNDIPSINTRNVARFIDCRRLEVNKSSPTSIWDNTYSSINYNFYNTYDWYTESGFYEEGTTNYKVGFEPGATNMDIDFSTYLEPYFVFSASKVGTTTIENYEGNIPCYYTTSFPRWSNSYSTNREIGSLYIDKNYILEDIFYPAIYINKYNWEQTKHWNYTGYQFFKEEEIDGYLRYSISIENNLLTAPYFYNLNLKSVDTNLSEDLNINFGVINKPNTGGTITDNSGDTISGDEIKDNTTPGDINNTLEEIFQEPDEGELKKQQEENINEIKEQITNELNNNEVFGALTTAEQGLIEILEGEPRRF